MQARESSSRRRHQRGRRRGVLIALLVVTALLVAGGAWWTLHRGGGGGDLALRARTAFDKGDFASAAVDLKTLLKEAPNDGAARALLGRAYFKSGNVPAAMKEFERARELGVREDDIERNFVRGYILLGKFDRAAAELALHSGDASADWQVLGGMLQLAQQHVDDARKTFEGVLGAHPEHDEARRGLVQAQIAGNDVAGARGNLDKLLETNKNDVGLWTLEGQLDLHDRDAASARKSFQHALDLAPKNPLAVLGMAEAELAAGEPDAASARLEALGDAADEDPRVNYLRARIAERRGDSDTALLQLNKVLHVSPDHVDSLVMAARLNFSLGQYSRALEFAHTLLQLEPDNEAAKRLLGAVQLASGQLDGLSQLGGDDVSQIKDPGTLALVGTAYLKHGNFKDAESSLSRAAMLAPDSAPIRTQLALGKLSAGHAAEAVGELKEVIATHPEFDQAHVMLALAYLADKKQADAEAAARGLIAARPDAALPHNVLGYVLESTDAAAARAEYEAAVAKDENFHPARINLARLALKEGNRDGARKQFDAVIARDQYNTHALLGLAALALEKNQVDEAEKLWQQAREHNPEAVAPRLLLARSFRARGKQAQSVDMIKEAYKLAPFAPQVQAEYATTMSETGNLKAALDAARALSERAPNSLAALELLARVYNQLGDEAHLTETLQRVTEVAPDSANAQLLLARLAIRHKDYAAAEKVAARLEGRTADAALGHELHGDIALAQGDREAALSAYRKAFAGRAEVAQLLKLDRLERDMGQNQQRLTAWLKAHPDDLQVRLAQASYLQEQGSQGDAIAEYEQLIEKDGKNAIALNNLAWLYFEKGDARALDLARRASELAPRQPEILDTYGWVLHRQGQHEQGLKVLQQAADLVPDNPDIGYHMAAALADGGQRADALTRLRAVLDRHAKFALRKDAEALAAKLASASP